MRYLQLKQKFLKHFDINHLSLDLLDCLEHQNKNAAKQFIVGKFWAEFTKDELKNIFNLDTYNYFWQYE